MLLIPAIDLKDGQCVRLRQGRMDDVTVFSDDPVAIARRWVDEGAQRLGGVSLAHAGGNLLLGRRGRVHVGEVLLGVRAGRARRRGVRAAPPAAPHRRNILPRNELRRNNGFGVHAAEGQVIPGTPPVQRFSFPPLGHTP